MNKITQTGKSHFQKVQVVFPYRSRFATRFSNAFTLIELLVVMTIMVMLVAASMPMLKFFFESQKTKNAAETVAAALQRVRFKAMEENRSYGIQFIPFETNNFISLQMRLVKEGNNYLNLPEVRVRIVDGLIKLCVYESNAWTDSPTNPIATALLNSANASWQSRVLPGYQIQFGRQGRMYIIGEYTTDPLPPNNKIPTLAKENGDRLIITLPDIPGASTTEAMEFRIFQPARSSLTPPVVLPRGTVIDLPFSNGFSGSQIIPFNRTPPAIIIFTPNGYVDYFDGNYRPFYGGLIYFCIGEWDRQITGYEPNNTPVTLAEDGKNNLETPTNFWVTLNPKTGQVRITETAPIYRPADWQDTHEYPPGSGTTETHTWKDNYHDACQYQRDIIYQQTRKYATEHFGIGK